MRDQGEVCVFRERERERERERDTPILISTRQYYAMETTPSLPPLNPLFPQCLAHTKRGKGEGKGTGREEGKGIMQMKQQIVNASIYRPRILF